jgi:hypothetical protein
METIHYQGTTLRPWWNKINPIWWLGNDEGIDPSFHPEKSQLDRAFYWFFRNLFHNFMAYVVGFNDRPITVTGPKPAELPIWIDANESGWKWAIVHPVGWPLWLPFISYSKGKFAFYIGWIPSGGILGLRITW